MSDNMNRRDFLKGAATGVGVGLLGAMGLYSYSPIRKQHFTEAERKMTDIGMCRSVKVTNISETSWFDNGTLMGDIKGAGGLLVNQYDYNWPPFGNGKGHRGSVALRLQEGGEGRLQHHGIGGEVVNAEADQRGGEVQGVVEIERPAANACCQPMTRVRNCGCATALPMASMPTMYQNSSGHWSISRWSPQT